MPPNKSKIYVRYLPVTFKCGSSSLRMPVPSWHDNIPAHTFVTKPNIPSKWQPSGRRRLWKNTRTRARLMWTTEFIVPLCYAWVHTVTVWLHIQRMSIWCLYMYILLLLSLVLNVQGVCVRGGDNVDRFLMSLGVQTCFNSCTYVQSMCYLHIHIYIYIYIYIYTHKQPLIYCSITLHHK